MPDPLAHLNPAQRDAVKTLSGPLLILAGAGTGKTRVITYRMAELIKHGTPPDKILSVTFTNKAANEMQERTRQLLGKSLRKKPHVSTFHALCVRILRQEITVLGYPNHFTIYDRGDQESLARTALRDIRVPEKSLKPGDLLSKISRWKMMGVHPKSASETAEDDLDCLAASAYKRYQASLKACAAVDFDDLLWLTAQIFAEHDDVLARHQRRFDHVQIDEYQDTNGMQFEIVEALVREHRNICVVGDDDQSIYGWRGAELRHILGFQQVFPGTKVIRLEDNYRCTDQILELANRLVKHNRDRHDKQLIAHKFAENSVRFVEFPDEQLEAQHVVAEIGRVVQARKAAPSDIAILFRTNEQPRIFETELRRARLPYVVLGSMSFFDRREIRDLMSYLKVIVNPDDEISLLRIINTPARGIGTTTVEKIIAKSVQNRQRFWETAAAMINAGELPKPAVAGLTMFRDLLHKYSDLFADHPRRMSHTLKELIHEIDYESEIEKQYKEPQQQLLRTAMVEELVETMKQYEQRIPPLRKGGPGGGSRCGGFRIPNRERPPQPPLPKGGEGAGPSLPGFLEESALTDRDEEGDKEEQLEKQGVKLMTLHSAKGLEFPHVYLVGLEEGLLPHRRTVDDPTASVDEERRLAYVGVTRARDHLTLSRAASRMKWGKRRPSIPSRFLFEMRGLEFDPGAEVEVEFDADDDELS